MDGMRQPACSRSALGAKWYGLHHYSAHTLISLIGPTPISDVHLYICVRVYVRPPTFCLVAILKVESKELELELELYVCAVYICACMCACMYACMYA